MLGLGPTELIIVLVLVVIIFGAGKLPDIGSALGRSIREFRSTMREEEPDQAAPELESPKPQEPKPGP
ncbi:MAG: twin-arginine translocase TatA/TatE family subunit [Chloroflexi bacterium]|nr:twin-arginine translocase TatA/TatE family subunit [Chloroflexota bacterium]